MLGRGHVLLLPFPAPVAPTAPLDPTAPIAPAASTVPVAPTPAPDGGTARHVAEASVMIGHPYPRRSVLCALATSRHSLRYCHNKVFLDQSLASAYHYSICQILSNTADYNVSSTSTCKCHCACLWSVKL